jgi:hypothetical protein
MADIPIFDVSQTLTNVREFNRHLLETCNKYYLNICFPLGIDNIVDILTEISTNPALSLAHRTLLISQYENSHIEMANLAQSWQSAIDTKHTDMMHHYNRGELYHNGHYKKQAKRKRKRNTTGNNTNIKYINDTYYCD